MKPIKFTALTAVVLLVATPVLAQDTTGLSLGDDAWHGELMPYAWATGIDGTLTVKNQRVKVDESFSDLWDNVTFGGSLLAAASKGHFTSYGQVDYFDLDTNSLSGAPQGSSAGTKVYIYTLAAGYRFEGSKGRHYDLMLGLRTLSMDNYIRLAGIASASGSSSTYDGVVVFRPYMPLSQRWSFSPTLSVGAGQSQLTYELWPQVQFQFAKNWAARVGYRRLFYRIDNDNKDSDWDGSMSGLMVGVGATW